MNIENHVWELATRKLANEASEEELRELDFLLAENPNLKNSLNELFDWWDNEPENTATNSCLLFQKILKSIKPALEAATPNNMEMPITAIKN
jgi:putative ABC transport system permease protein